MTIHLPAAVAWLIAAGWVLHWAVDAAITVAKYRLERDDTHRATGR